MHRYLATFPAGAYPILQRRLKQFDMHELQIVSHDESSVLFDSSINREKLIELRFFTNVYVDIESGDSVPRSWLNGTFFRVLALKNGAPRELSEAEKDNLESKVGQQYGLTANTHQSKNDFCLMERQDGLSMLTLRLAKARFKREKQQQGELRPELAHILCLAAGLQSKHTFIDPFAGYGSIPLEAIRGFGCKNIMANDTQQYEDRHEHAEITWHQADATDLSFIDDASIDRVVTDPPWGKYEANLDLAQLYVNFGKELARMLKPGGTAVILSGYSQASEQLSAQPDIAQVASWPVLISGQKATIIKLRKDT